MTFSGLTRDRIFGEDHVAKQISRLRPACDPPLKAGFVFLGSRLLANQRDHSALDRARSQSELPPETAPLCRSAEPLGSLCGAYHPLVATSPYRIGQSA